MAIKKQTKTPGWNPGKPTKRAKVTPKIPLFDAMRRAFGDGTGKGNPFALECPVDVNKLRNHLGYPADTNKLRSHPFFLLRDLQEAWLITDVSNHSVTPNKVRSDMSGFAPNGDPRVGYLWPTRASAEEAALYLLENNKNSTKIYAVMKIHGFVETAQTPVVITRDEE